MVNFSVDYRLTAFPQTFPSRGSIQFTDSDLAHALFVTGRASGTEWDFGASSVWEFLHRATIIPAYLRSHSGHVVKSQLAGSLDRSEKVGVSYSLGQAMTGIFCERRLGVSRLIHHDRFERVARESLGYRQTRKRPDLLGRGTRGWVVAEAKGRSNRMERDLVPNLQNQKRSIGSISGQPPWLAIGCVSSFPNGRLELDVVDPEEPAQEAVDLIVDDDLMAVAYYGPFLRLFDLAGFDGWGGIADVSFGPTRLVRIEGLSISIGLPVDLEQRLRLAEQGETRGLAESISELVPPIDADRRPGEYPDGSYFAANWDLPMLSQDVAPPQG